MKKKKWLIQKSIYLTKVKHFPRSISVEALFGQKKNKRESSIEFIYNLALALKLSIEDMQYIFDFSYDHLLPLWSSFLPTPDRHDRGNTQREKIYKHLAH